MNPDIITLIELAAEATMKIWQAVADAKAGKLDPQKPLDAINDLHSRLSADNAKIDQEIDAKFGK